MTEDRVGVGRAPTGHVPTGRTPTGHAPTGRTTTGRRTFDRVGIDLAGIGFVAVWSSGYIGGSMAASSIAPLAANLWRFVIGGSVLALIALRRREAWPHGRRELAAVAGVGVLLFTVQFGGLYIGMSSGTPATTTALIACSSPLLVAVVGAVLRWDLLPIRRWAGVGLGVVGVVVTLVGRIGRPPTLTALAWTLFGLAGLAAGTILQGRLRLQAGPAAMAATEIAAATVVMAVWAPLEGRSRFRRRPGRSAPWHGSRSCRGWSVRCCSSP